MQQQDQRQTTPDRTFISTPHSYSAAVRTGDTIYFGLHRGQGETFAKQLESALKSLKKTLGKLGCDVSDIVQIHVYLNDIQNLGEMEKLFRSVFEPGSYPARMTSTTEFWDSDCRVMLDGVAYHPVTD